MSNFIFKLREFMIGRNGIDKLTYGILALYCILAFAELFFNGSTTAVIIISLLQAGLVGYAVFRIFSKNLQKRYNENFRFEQLLNSWKPYFERLKLRITFFRTHRFRKCRHCGEFLRLKKTRGKRNIVCPKCSKENHFFILF